VTEPTAGTSAPEDAAALPESGPDAADSAPAVAAADAQPPVSPSDAALARYQHSLRRHRIVYYAVLAVLLAAVGSVVGVAWSHGEVAHASLHTFRPPPGNLPLGSPSVTQQESWHTTDRLADGVPQWNGTVITFSDHTVGGRDARTGKRTWTYTRTDRTICTVGQAAGTTVAVFENRGNCDEVDAFYSGTGGRRWTRTLDFDGEPVNGRPAFQTTPSTFMVTTDSVIYALDPVTGYQRWTYQRNGCRIGRAVLGSTGALISQNCSDEVVCSGLKFCARGPQLILRDRDAGTDDKSKDNPDKIKWLKADDRTVPVSADQVVSTVEPDGTRLHLLDPGKGTQTQQVALNTPSGELGPISAIATTGDEVIWLAGRAYAIRAGAARPDWTAATSSPPTIVSTAGEDTPTLATARITVPTATGIGILDGNDGRTINRFTVQAPAPGSLVHPLGTGFLVSGLSGVVAYR
jgi:outer membrane protein assembly factor BamB